MKKLLCFIAAFVAFVCVTSSAWAQDNCTYSLAFQQIRSTLDNLSALAATKALQAFAAKPQSAQLCEATALDDMLAISYVIYSKSTSRRPSSCLFLQNHHSDTSCAVHWTLSLLFACRVAHAETFELDANHIRLLKQSGVIWGFVESGAPMVVLPGMFNLSYDGEELVCNIPAIASTLALGKASAPAVIAQANRYCEEAGKALSVALLFGSMEPGNYTMHWPLASHKDAANLAPPGIQALMVMPRFQLTADHLKLLKAAMVWHDSTAIDGKRPYGSMTYYFYDMSILLGRNDGPRGKGGYPKALENELERLHFETMPALQVFLREVRLMPGRYTRKESYSDWEPAQ
jgi:hypothetical protein